MPDWLWIAIAAAAAVILVALMALVARKIARRRRTHALQSRFGEEYDRKVRDEGSRRRAEAQLADVSHKHDRLDLRPLNASSRGRYLGRWHELQSRFLDQPGYALDGAELLLVEVLRERGYDADDFDEAAPLLALDRQDLARQYRSAHATQARAHTGLVGTEDARVAMIQYRSLLEALLADGSSMHESPSRDEVQQL
jgi:hypothetical protein